MGAPLLDVRPLERDTRGKLATWSSNRETTPTGSC
jgi:hypothetical protein